MSRDYPAEYGREPQYRNPEGTVPFPRAHDIPITEWSQQVDVDWGAGTASVVAPWGNSWTFVWQSPVFDLRPALRSSVNRNTAKVGQAIWDKSTRMFIMLATSPTNVAFPASGLGVLATEFVSITTADPAPRPGEGFPTPGASVSNVRTNDVTAQFTPTALGAPQAVQTGFAPPGTTLGFGAGHPLRYWRLRLTFTFFFETGLPIPPAPVPGQPGAPPIVQLQAAVY